MSLPSAEKALRFGRGGDVSKLALDRLLIRRAAISIGARDPQREYEPRSASAESPPASAAVSPLLRWSACEQLTRPAFSSPAHPRVVFAHILSGSARDVR
ncbi:hypothetical protein SMICM304S_07605 [Streptomyces microflavus]